LEQNRKSSPDDRDISLFRDELNAGLRDLVKRYAKKTKGYTQSPSPSPNRRHQGRAKRYLSFNADIEAMDIEAEVVEMKQMLIDISRKIDDVLDESLTAALMKLSEESILELYEGEPDLYSIEDLKVRYK